MREEIEKERCSDQVPVFYCFRLFLSFVLCTGLFLYFISFFLNSRFVFDSCSIVVESLQVSEQ